MAYGGPARWLVVATALVRWLEPATASGPKNVVVVMDTSGSMNGARIELARSALKATINTLADSDYAAVVRYSYNATSNSEMLQAVTDEVKESFYTWIDANIIAGGPTYYKRGFAKAFEVLRASRSAGATANGNTTILFLSDGDPNDWESADFAQLQSDAEGVGVTAIITYQLGSAVTINGKSILEQIARDNGGIYHYVPDGSQGGDDLCSVMAKFDSQNILGECSCTSSCVPGWSPPTSVPTSAPTSQPTIVPTTAAPSPTPTLMPTSMPTPAPTKVPTLHDEVAGANVQREWMLSACVVAFATIVAA